MNLDNQRNKSVRNLFSLAALGNCYRKAVTVASSVFLHPMMLMSGGNNVLIWPDASPVGIATSLSTTALIAGTIVREKLTGREVGMPYFALSAANLITAGSILLPVFSDVVQQAPNLNWAAAASAVASATCMTVWGVGHYWRGQLRRRKECGGSDVPKKLSENPMLYTAAADGLMLGKTCLIDPIFFALTPIVLYGLHLALKLPSALKEAPQDVKQFAAKHVTSARVLGISYVGMALMAHGHNAAFVAGASALWSCAFAGLEPKLNREIIPDCLRVLRRQFGAPKGP
jgi:hypothetical protein